LKQLGEELPQSADASDKPTVVGIGASAGGLNALKRLFESIPPDNGLVFVVVVHLSPEHKSHLADLLQPSVRFPVRQVTETMPLERNNVYVIPPNANLSAIDTHLRLSKLEELRRERAPIDHFFRTLASTHDGHSIGVILTGTGSDGTLGLKEIKAKGGLILVQDPNEAEFDGMPQSAIATGLVDRVLSVADIPDALLRLARIGPRIALAKTSSDEVVQPERILLPKVVAILKARTERDFSRYKPATILRRIARRMQLNYIEDFEQYLDRLRENAEETRALADDLLITVTSFFRDPDVFDRLEREVVPKLFEGKGPTQSLRIWSVGCATGEEAYSIAMLLLEEAARHEAPPRIQIFASDLHKRSLDGAREGLYPGDIETDVNADRLRRFFQKENGGFRISKDVRDTVVFAPHNLLADPPFSRLDLITCRNLLIYLDRSVQRDVVDLFHYALCPDGYLLLGSAETIDASDLFRTEDKKLCIYRKRNVPAPEPRLPVFPLTRVRIPGETIGKSEDPAITIPYQNLHQDLLERYAPPSILVGPDNKLKHLSENAGRYLIHPGGEVTSSVLRLVRDELRIELQSLLQHVREKKELIDSKPISVRFNGHAAPVVMHVRPAQDSEQDGFALVIFEEHQPQPEKPVAVREPGQDSRRVAELEAELNAFRQRLQTIIEEYETSREEMKASNEEMQSTNEELRSTMEELETSKEELQSINEELQTVNQENRHKVEELSQLSSDLQNLLSATDIATLFLDRDLRILRFTPRLADLFNIRITDRARPISDLTHRLGYPQLRDDARVVLDRLIPIERETRDDQGRWYLTRVLPYRSSEDRIEGIVITFTEITTRKLAEEALRVNEKRLLGQKEAFQAAMKGAPLQESLKILARLVTEETGGAARTAFYIADPDFTRLHPVPGAGDMPDSYTTLVDRFPIGNESLACGLASASGIPILTRDVLEEPLWKPWRNLAKEHDFRGCWSFPIETPDLKPFGTFAMYFRSPRDVTPYDLGLAEMVTQTAAIIISRDAESKERSRSEQNRHEMEERQRVLLEGMPQLVWRSQADGRWTWASPQWFRFTGQTEAESLGSGWLNALHPDDRDLVQVAWASAAANGILDVNYRLRRAADGSFLWHHTRALPVRTPEGKVSEWLGTSTDIEELKRAERARLETEEKFRLFVDNVQEYALVQTDPNGLITNWNPGAERLFGYKSDQVLGKDFSVLLTSEDQSQGVFPNELAIVSSGERHEDARWFVRSDGSRFWARWITEPIKDESGRFRGLAKIMRDETERERADAFTRHSLSEKEELLKEVHHRVKNNLQVIISLLNMQSFQIEDQTVLNLFRETQNRVLAISSIHELIYRADSFASIHLSDYARQLIPGLVRFYGLDQRVQTQILGDGATLELERAVPYGMLLNELVSNACKHAFPDGSAGTITVTFQREKDAIVLTVGDTGPGLPEGFDYQKASSLGLKLVHGLVRQLRGTIEITVASGTMVKVRFPTAGVGGEE
jgi:PAS domain S-box-containing protein